MTHLHPQRPSLAWGGGSSHRPTLAWGGGKGAANTAVSLQLTARPQASLFPLAIVCSLCDFGQDLVNLVTFLVSFLGLRSLLLPSRRKFPFLGNSNTAAGKLGDRVLAP